MFRAALLAAALVFPPHYGLVNDTANMLGDTTQLENKLRDYQARTGNVIVVVSVPTLGSSDIKEYANGLFHEWGIGDRGKDNGVLILWAVQERKVRIEVGYGLEPLLTDGRSGQILRELILPEFKAGRYMDGLNAGVSAIITQLEFRPTEQPVEAPQPSGGTFPWFSVLSVLGGVGTLLIGLVYYRTRQNRIEEETRLDALRRVQERYFTEQAKPRPVAPYVKPLPPVTVAKPKKATYVAPVETPTRRDFDSSYPSSSSSWDSSSSSSGSWDSGSSFGGGDSGGGGADGSY